MLFQERTAAFTSFADGVVPSITGIDNVEGTLTTLLTAHPAGWEDISGTFDLDFGTVALDPHVSGRLMARGFLRDLFKGAKDLVSDIRDGIEDGIDDIKDGFKDVGDAFRKIGDAKIDKQVVFDVSVGTEGKRTNIITDKLKCIPVQTRIVLFCAKRLTPKR
jgi:hypothetical protein